VGTPLVLSVFNLINCFNYKFLNNSNYDVLFGCSEKSQVTSFTPELEGSRVSPGRSAVPIRTTRDEVKDVLPHHSSSSLTTTFSTSSESTLYKQIKKDKNIGKLFSKEELLDFEEDIPSEDVDNFKNTTPWESSNLIINNDNNKVIIEGSNWFKQQFNILYNEYSYIFTSVLDGEPANLPPMQLNVDESKWYKPSNSTSPRPQFKLKCEEIKNKLINLY